MVDHVLSLDPRQTLHAAGTGGCASAGANTRRSSTSLRAQGYVRVRVDEVLYEIDACRRWPCA